MNTEILFMPLGGGQRVGASCYYLQLGNNHIMLDAGIGNNKNLKFNPVISQLTALHSFYSLNQINQIFISHAHMDHVGY
ncbi:MAG: MBL fold metallo-hydrolase, partial [Oscillospiraceae bacterium]|nr:MBL fold metallo-hydrolase [Oscillospiraceae bacterium]